VMSAYLIQNDWNWTDKKVKGKPTSSLEISLCVGQTCCPQN